MTGEPCYYWNRKLGRCGARGAGPCREGFVHGICDVCYRQGHRSCDVHKEKGKGKGKHEKGKKGSGKKGDKGKKGEKEWKE